MFLKNFNNIYVESPCCYIFIHSFDKYLMSVYDVQGTGLALVKEIKDKDKLPGHEEFIPCKSNKLRHTNAT